uniref:Retrotransposon gag domain-containing protein n=1 Tax=Vitis vinifera TaxID=29760 RepID=A5C994_VITVI|nr:hypothetical protein VITISV_020469 [Vitis vinifera]
MLQTVCKLDLKRRSYGRLKTTVSSSVKFRSCEMSCEMKSTCEISQGVSQLRNHLHAHLQTTLRNHLKATNQVTNHLQVTQTNSKDVSSEDEWLGSLCLGVKKAGCACHIEYEIAEEAMNFMSYVAEVSRGWDEPNARDMGRVTSQPNAKGEMYILNDGIDMKANIAAMARRLEELEMKKMEEVQAISQTPLQAMPCAICLSYEHLVEECPTIPAMREMFGDCNTYNSNWRNHPNFSWKPQPP